MKLFLLRHAEAHGTYPDFERELTEKGACSLADLAERLNAHELANVREVWHSPLVRAQQTAEIFAEMSGLGHLPQKARDDVTPDDLPAGVAESLVQREGQGDLLLVGHNPHLTGLASLLLAGDGGAGLIRFKKSGMLCLSRVETHGLRSSSRPFGFWELCWYLIPRLNA